MGWNDGLTRPVALGELGQRYRHYRLADPDAEEAMAGSLRRWGQLSPLVACVRAGKFELIDGFKCFAAAGQIHQLTSLSVRVLEVDEPTAKAAILSLNRDQRPVRELEEAWVVQGLVHDDSMTQVEAAHLLGRHKSWICRRLALLEKLSVAVKEDLRLGLVGPSLARQLTRLPVGNQEALLALARRATLTMPEVSGVIDLLVGSSAEQAAFVLAHHQRRIVGRPHRAMADQTLPDRVRFYAKFHFLIIDEFGFDRIERSLCPQGVSLWYKIIDARSQRASTALVTNIDFDSWATYLGDPQLAMAVLDRVVDGTTIVKLKGKSYRMHRGPGTSETP